MTKQGKFLQYINDNYDRLKVQFEKFCRNKKYNWSEDVFSETIMKCYDLIERKGGMTDDSPQGIDNYLFLSFKNNTLRETQYARNSKRQELADINGYLLKNDKLQETVEDKLVHDLREDFNVIYVLQKIEKQFGNETAHLVALKHLSRMTYRQIAKKTNDKTSRKKILDAMAYVRENVTIDELDDKFAFFLNEV